MVYDQEKHLIHFTDDQHALLRAANPCPERYIDALCAQAGAVLLTCEAELAYLGNPNLGDSAAQQQDPALLRERSELARSMASQLQTIRASVYVASLMGLFR